MADPVGLSLDYDAICPPEDISTQTVEVWAGRLLGACIDRYVGLVHSSDVVIFDWEGAHFAFDYASRDDAVQADRTIAAWAQTPARPRPRLEQRPFPIADGQVAVDRGHLIPHLSGGLLGPNLFTQNRPLNRGWSEAGRRCRSREREVARTVGAFYFGHLVYDDESAVPVRIETGLVRDGHLDVEAFDNPT